MNIYICLSNGKNKKYIVDKKEKKREKYVGMVIQLHPSFQFVYVL